MSIVYHSRMLFYPGRAPRDDFLDPSRDIRLTFDGNRPPDSSWHTDPGWAEIRGADPEAVYEAAVDWLFTYRLFPEDRVHSDSAFLREGRLPRPGDRIVQTFRVIPGLLHGLAVSVVTNVLHQPARRGLTVQTTGAHFVSGELSLMVSQRPDGAALLVQSISRPSRRVPFFLRGFARRLQLAAHNAMLERFQTLGGIDQGGTP